jgi:hypothetical protein
MFMEVWKDIKGYEGKYQISSYGRVKSLKRRTRTNHLVPERLLNTTTRLTKDGYCRVTLIGEHGRGDAHDYRVHRLVAQAFIPNPENKATVNHIDGDKTNNHVENLEWNTREENMQHAYKHHLKKSMQGALNDNAKLTPEQVRQIRKEYIPQSTKYGTVALAKKYGVTNRVIGLVVRHKAYRNV